MRGKSTGSLSEEAPTDPVEKSSARCKSINHANGDVGDTPSTENDTREENMFSLTGRSTTKKRVTFLVDTAANMGDDGNTSCPIDDGDNDLWYTYEDIEEFRKRYIQQGKKARKKDGNLFDAIEEIFLLTEDICSDIQSTENLFDELRLMTHIDASVSVSCWQ